MTTECKCNTCRTTTYRPCPSCYSNEVTDWDYCDYHVGKVGIPNGHHLLTEYICECEGILDFEDGFYICVNPDCEVITVPSTLLQEVRK